MGFTFGFTEDDFSDDDFQGDKNVSGSEPTINSINPLDSFQAPDNHQPKFESLENILRSLVNVTISFTTSSTIQNNVVYRRDLFDVKHQLMSEDNIGNDTDEFQILLGDTNEDLKTNVYEGGLKSWECSFDTVDKLSKFTDINQYHKIVEIGCGTALPSCYLLKKIVENNTPTKGKLNLKLNLILTDYNYSVLRLVTVPNLILSWASTLSSDIVKSLQENKEGREFQANELLLTQNLLDKFYEDLKDNGITLYLISGSWCKQYVNMINKISNDTQGNGIKELFVSSETIYSPSMLPVISEVIIGLQNNGNKDNLAIVAAKDIYFGVGGSIVDFVNYLDKKISTGTNIKYNFELINYGGLKRTIVEIKNV